MTESIHPPRRIYVCLNDDCRRRGSQTVYAELRERLAGRDDVEVHEYICFANCEHGANVVVHPDRVWFSGLRAGHAGLVSDYICSGDIPEAHCGKVDEELAQTVYELLELLDADPALKDGTNR